MRALGKLSARKAATINEPGRYGDGGGLWLQVSEVGRRVTKAWLFRFTMHGRERQMGLGSVETYSLAEARDRARNARQLVADGIDPIEARQEKRATAKLEAARGIAFKEAAEKFIAAYEATWTNEKHRDQWRATLETYAYPAIGSLPVGAIDTALVLKVLEPIWATKPETASRVQQRMKRVLDWAKARGYRSGDNPAAWTGHLDKLLPAQSKRKRVKHHAALPWTEIPQFMSDLRKREGISALALEFTILTAARTGETIGAQRAEINFSDRVWTVPARRMKTDREHRVPLADRALDVLQSLPREKGNDFVFIGDRVGRPLSNMAMLELLKGMRPGLTVHGFRSTFRDWAAETTNNPNHVVEMALAHLVSGEVEAAYRRGDLFEKRQRLMRDWAKYCATKPAARTQRAGNVVPIRAKA